MTKTLLLWILGQTAGHVYLTSLKKQYNVKVSDMSLVYKNTQWYGLTVNSHFEINLKKIKTVSKLFSITAHEFCHTYQAEYHRDTVEWFEAHKIHYQTARENVYKAYLWNSPLEVEARIFEKREILLPQLHELVSPDFLEENFQRQTLIRETYLRTRQYLQEYGLVEIADLQTHI